MSPPVMSNRGDLWRVVSVIRCSVYADCSTKALTRHARVLASGSFCLL
jgi:hypothetical protein